MKKGFFPSSLLFFLTLTVCPAVSQRNILNSDLLRTLQVTVNDKWGDPPLIRLGTPDYLTVSFDELSHEYHRYTYYLTHCNADWQPSSLFEIDYLNGVNGQQIEDYENSVNTTMLYTHYRLRLPNEDVQMKVSGNYILSVYDDNDAKTPVLQACFSVLEPRVRINATVSSNTDIDTNNSHQQVSFTIGTEGYNIPSPQSELTAVVYQNRRPDNRVTVKEPTYIIADQLQYVHNRSLIFDAGNEYRRFEILNMYNPSMNVDKIQFFNPYFHAFLDSVKIRRNYSYDEDQNGRFFIRSLSAQDSDTEADYLFVHYRLQAPESEGGDFYVAGDFSQYLYTPQYRAGYNPETQSYENIQLLKQGSYNYLYLWVPDAGKIGETGPACGNFYETENEYMVMLYHRPFGERYDKLVGFNMVRFSQE